jgi:hypothetical protein
MWLTPSFEALSKRVFFGVTQPLQKIYLFIGLQNTKEPEIHKYNKLCSLILKKLKTLNGSYTFLSQFEIKQIFSPLNIITNFNTITFSAQVV